MIKHSSKILFIITSCITLISCSNSSTLYEELALSMLNDPQKPSGYAVSMVSNNPRARGENASGWTCKDKQILIDAGVVTCKESGRSGVYLDFSDEGKKLMIGEPWGDTTLRNVRVIAVKQIAQQITAIKMADDSHATVSFDRIYSEHTPFSNHVLQKLIQLNTPQKAQTNFTLIDNEWVIQ